MLRALLIASLGLAAAMPTFADDDDRGRRGRHEYRHDRGDSRHWQDRRHERRWRGRDRVYVVPAPPVYGYRPAPPRHWYPGWREPYRNGYRYWQNDRYWYAEPGRPALELSLLLPLH